MHSGLLRSAGKVVLYLAIIATIVGAFAITSPEAFVRVPPEKMPDLVGDWYVDRFGSFRRYIFNKDGSGEILVPGRETRKFQWGTEGNRLRMKYKTQGGWSAPLYDVQLGKEVNLKAVESGYSMVMKRQPPASASLQ